MLNLGYFTHSSISPSETFIFDLVKGLDSDNEIDLTYVGGKSFSLNKSYNIKNIPTGFFDKYEKISFYIRKIGQVFGGKGDNWRMRFKQMVSLRQLRKAGLPKFDVAFIDYGTSAVLVYKYLFYKKIPFIVNINVYDASSKFKDLAYLREIVNVFEIASAFIAPSNHLKRRLILAGCPPEKIHVLHYGIEVKEFQLINWEIKKQNNPSVIFLGRLTPKKNPIALIYAFKQVQNVFPSCEFTIIGGGELGSLVESTILKLGLKNNIKLLGVLPREESFPILSKHWIYAQHSVTSSSGDQEGFPLSLAEAAGHALPLVSTIHSGINENIIDGVTGFLVQEYDYEAMAEKIIYLIQNPDIVEKMGKAGREHIMSLCNPEKRIESIKQILLISSISIN